MGYGGGNDEQEARSGRECGRDSAGCDQGDDPIGEPGDFRVGSTMYENPGNSSVHTIGSGGDLPPPEPPPFPPFFANVAGAMKKVRTAMLIMVGSTLVNNNLFMSSSARPALGCHG